MKILSLILSTTMLINSIPCTHVHAGLPHKLEQEIDRSQQRKSTPLTTDNFKIFKREIREEGLPYIDKSLFIKAILEDNNIAIAITRARRWGKSLNLSMLKYFLMPEVDEYTGQRATKRVNTRLFDDLLINNGNFINSREILNCLLLATLEDAQDYDDAFFRDRDRSAEMASLAGQPEALTKQLLKKTITIPQENIEALKASVKEYGGGLVEKFSAIHDLSTLLKELNQLDAYAQKSTQPEKQAEWAYNTKFEELRLIIEEKINSSVGLKSKLREFDLMSRYQGQHPTILLSLKEAKGDSYKDFESQLRLKISELFKEYPYILKNLDKQSKENSDVAQRLKAESDFKKFTRIYVDDAADATEQDLKDSLRFLSDLLYQYHGKKTYILIDEYDAPPNHLLFKEGATKAEILPVAKLISDMLSPLCKGNEFVEKVVLTGVFDTLYKEVGSGLNNVIPYTILDRKFSEYYGFSELEIRNKFIPSLFLKIEPEDIDTLMRNLEEWYDGYTDRKLYTPWAVVRHLKYIIDSSQEGIPFEYSLTPQSNWSQSGADDALEKIARIYKKLQSSSSYNANMDISRFLVSSHPYQERVKPHSIASIFSEMADKAEVLRYVLISFGYLTAKAGEIKTPNREVRELYEDYFKGWIRSIGLNLSSFDISDAQEYEKRMKDSLKILRSSTMIQNESGIQSVVDMLCLFSNMLNYDFGQRVTHAMAIGVLNNAQKTLKALIDKEVSEGQDASESMTALKEIKSIKKNLKNKQTQSRRKELDSLFLPKAETGDTAVLNEFKYTDTSSSTDTLLQEALSQIYNNNYWFFPLLLIGSLPEYSHIKKIKIRGVVFTKGAANDNTNINFKMEENTHEIDHEKLSEFLKNPKSFDRSALLGQKALSYKSLMQTPKTGFHTLNRLQQPFFFNDDQKGVIYEGVHEGQRIHFKEHAIVEDGDCGFHGLGVSRGQGLQQLLTTRDPEVRDMVIDDMFEALMAREFPTAALDERLIQQYAAYQETSREEDRLQLRTSLLRPEVYRPFLENYLGGNGWLSYVRGGRGILNALARLNNINIFVWTSGARTPGQGGQLEAIHSAVQENPQNTVHLLHTHGMTHFNLLEVDTSNRYREVGQRINFLANAEINSGMFFDEKLRAQYEHYLNTGERFNSLRRYYAPEALQENQNARLVMPRHLLVSINPNTSLLQKTLMGIKHLVFRK